MIARRPFLQATAIAAALAVVPLATAAMAQSDREAYRELELFMDVFARVKASYVDKVDDKTLIKGAINGMLQSLDPHSGFVDGIDYSNLRMMTEGSYGGLGLTIQGEDGAIKVIAPQEDTPAWRAGVKAGDYITHVDGKLVVGMSSDEAVMLMRGAPGTPVTLTLIRAGRDKPIIASMKRETIVQKAVKWETKGDIGVLNINTFSETTAPETLAAMEAIEAKLGRKPAGYVIDLRDNGGGLLNQAVAVSDIFLSGGQIVSQRGRLARDNEQWFAETMVKGDLAKGIPVVVLTNAGTASASEIVAGALQDHHRAIVLGERSFGKGSVQTVLEGEDGGLPNGTALRLTTARYYLPKGRSVQEGGIDPDIRVPQLSDPDYKSRLTVRESDLRRHLVAEAKVDNKLLEDDAAPDPRFTASADDLKKAGVTDFQLDYAVKTVARITPNTPLRAAANAKPRAR
jgi:carboxyl-terminal processing protease